MNILLITYQGDMAGSTNSISFLAMGLAKKGHTVVVGCRQESLLAKLVAGSSVIVEPMTFSGRFDYTNMKQIRRVVEQYDIELINAQSSLDRYTTVFARWLFRLPVALVHTRRQYPLSIGGFIQNLIYVKGTDRIVVISDSLRDIFVEKGTPKEHLQVIYNGIPEESFSPVNPKKVDALRLQYGIEPEDRVVGCVSRPKKQAQLLEALSHLDPAIKLLLVGVPKGHYDSTAAALNLKNQILYAGKVTPEEVKYYYRLFDLLVLPSTTEGFGLVLVEAMGVGVPVIGTRAQGIVDVLEHGRNGLLFDDGDTEQLAGCIDSLLTDEDLRKKMIARGLEVAHDRFSITATVNAYEQFFRELIAQRQSGR